MRIRSVLPALRRGALALAAAWALGSCTGDATSPLKTNRPPEPGTLSGEVRTQEGTAVAGARVELSGERAGSVQVAETDTAGAFAFEDLPGGRYTVAVVPPAGFESLTSTPQGVTLRPGAGATVALQVRAVRTAEVTVQPGSADTVALASGALVEVDAEGAAAPVTVKVAEDPSATFGELELAAPAVTLTTSGGGAPAASPRPAGASAAAEGDGSVRVTVWQRVANCSGGTTDMAFQAPPDGARPALVLFTEPTCTSYTDPATGRSTPVLAGSTALLPGGSLSIGTFAKDPACTAGERSLYAFPGAPENASRTPVILVHGWQPTKLLCRQYRDWEPGDATFRELAATLRADPAFGADHQLYVLRYPTFEPIANAVQFLREEVVRRGWQDREIVLVGHSMGGLVGRGYMAAHGGHVRALVTLGTPHAGSPLAQGGLAEAAAIAACTGRLGLLGAALYPRTAGLRDLGPTSPWITTLAGEQRGAGRIYTFAGDAGLGDTGALLFLPRCVLDLLTLGADDRRSDGIVPVASAVPSWTTMQTVLAGRTHLSITGGSAAGHVHDVVTRLAQCLPGTIPAAPAANAFPLAGTVARQGAGRIDVVLNPVVVDGVPRADLERGNFQVFENDCIKPFDITTDEGNVGVDLVFVQDLSGSMSGAISGVRGSVLSFAADLATRGLNVRIGSVGFSGPGTITTHANQSGCERVGPVHDLGAPADFQAHVTGSWFATGGCDGPENALEAVEYAHRNLTWRTGAARVFILITDISAHTAATSCNGLGACTDQTLDSIVELLGGTATVHAVAPADAGLRTQGGGLDPWLVAARTGGAQLPLGSGVVDLNALGIADRVADVVRLTFTSTSRPRAYHRIRVRVTVDGKVSELSPGLASYDIDPSLRRSPR